MYGFLPFLFLAYLINEQRNTSTSKYLALGDSLAVGIGGFWCGGYTRRYYSWLVNCLKLRHLSYCNLGVIGWTSEDLLKAVIYNNNFRNAIRNACIITISIGGNDIINCKHSPNKLYKALKCYKNNLYGILHEIRCLNKHAQIYLMDIYNPYPKGHEMHEISEIWITHFNTVIWNTLLHSDFKISGIAGVYSAFKGNEYKYTLIKHNNVHPNISGYRIISDCFMSITEI